MCILVVWLEVLTLFIALFAFATQNFLKINEQVPENVVNKS